MTMSSKDSWRELAELLGLPADAPPPQAAPEPNAETASDSSEEFGEEFGEESADELMPQAASPHDDVSELAERVPIERDEDDDEFFIPPLPSDSSDDLEVTAFEGGEEEIDGEADGEMSEESAESKPADDRPREGRRRRRGRRGRRRGGEEKEGGSKAETPEDASAARAEASETDEEPRGRRRRRQRDAEGEGEGEGDDVSTAVEDGVPAEEDGDDSDDFSKDAWADWNVPSWQDLIDGLYRPDRDR